MSHWLITNTSFTNADPVQISRWGLGTLVAYVSGGSSDPVAEAQDGTNLITNYLNMQPGQICVGATNTANSLLPAPNLSGIDGVPPGLVAPLIRQRILSTTAVTLFVFTLFPSLSGFMGIVEGLTFANSPTSVQEAVNTIVHSLSTATTFIQLVMSHCDALPAHWTIQQVVRTGSTEVWSQHKPVSLRMSNGLILNAVLGSITVVPLELASPCGPHVVWQVFMMVTTTNIVFYYALRVAFARVSFVTAFNNTGRVRNDMSCRICRYIDHPSALCPFPNIPGWMGPTPTSLPALAVGNSNCGGYSRGNTCGCGGRGRRTRGRGGRGN
ncbi:hypothetical protein B0H13DRAFT_1910126 [Mycena leptocephala]|nr:hypothetical protein B0H13DRAFT_1910126 [Mycena leptocephala]